MGAGVDAPAGQVRAGQDAAGRCVVGVAGAGGGQAVGEGEHRRGVGAAVREPRHDRRERGQGLCPPPAVVAGEELAEEVKGLGAGDRQLPVCA